MTVSHAVIHLDFEFVRTALVGTDCGTYTIVSQFFAMDGEHDDVGMPCISTEYTHTCTHNAEG